MKHPRFRVLQFSKSPAAGAVKSRLAPVLDDRRRRALHYALTRHTAVTVASARLCLLELWVDDTGDPYFAALAKELGGKLCAQPAGDLGQRLSVASQRSLRSACGVVLVGSDCPFLDAAYLDRALTALQRADVVIGPARDGGYVLLGLRRYDAALFRDIPWGTSGVLARTRERLDALGWRWQQLEALPDIDRPGDLELLKHPRLSAALRASW